MPLASASLFLRMCVCVRAFGLVRMQSEAHMYIWCNLNRHSMERIHFMRFEWLIKSWFVGNGRQIESIIIDQIS